MKIQIKGKRISFAAVGYELSISKNNIYLAYFSKESLRCRNWIYGENNKNTIEIQPKQLYCRDEQVLRYIK